MVLGHEASGVVGIAGRRSRACPWATASAWNPASPMAVRGHSKLGVYNVDPAVRFWATPPIHGCLTPHVVHPAAFT